MDAFVIVIQWGQNRPCPRCRPEGMIKPPPKNMAGVATMWGQDQKTGAWHFACHTCGHEFTRSGRL